MIKFLEKISEENILLDIVDGRLKLFSNNEEIDQNLLAEIKERKEEILSYLQDFGSFQSQNVSHENIPKIEQFDNYELSDAQKRLWTLSQIKDSSIAYNMPSHIKLDNNYDIAYFKKAIYAVIERHEILRTIFKENEKGEIRQWVLSPEKLNFKLDYLDYRNESNKEDLVCKYINNDSYKPFDLEKGPLLRASIMQVSDKSYVFYYNMHHIISDGWSRDILIKDVMEYYQSLVNDVKPELVELNIQYKDYAAWQLTSSNNEKYLENESYWLNKLSGEMPVLDLPSQKIRTKRKTYKGHRIETLISSELTGSLKTFSQENGGSLFISLLATWNLLLYRYTSLKDIIIGTPVAGREHADLDNQIGFYVNTLALRNNIDANDNFIEFYEKIKESTLQSFRHQTYPFDKLVDKLDLTIDPSRNPLFDVMLILQNTGKVMDIIDNENQIIDSYKDLGPGISKFDIEINFKEVGDYLLFYVNYNTDIYEYSMIKNLIQHYKNLIGSILEGPEQKIGDIDYLLEQDRYKLLDEFNDTKKSYPDYSTIIDLYKVEVEKQPNKIALIFEEKEFTYKQLDELSNQFANYLLKNHSIEIEDLIGVKLDRSEWLIISLLAILKTGGAYVPIDPKYPQQRIDHIEKDSNCKFTIDENTVKSFKKEARYSDTSCPKVKVTSKNLAYVMYTSGSTGKPKGVMIEQKNVIRLVKSSNYYRFSSKDTLLATGSFSFDATTFEYWGTLLNGSRLILCSNDTLLDNELLAYEIEKRDVNVMWFTAGWLNQLVESNLDIFRNLKTIISGGDKLSSIHIHKLRETYKNLEIINGYGPTENTTFSITYNIGKVSENIPIGQPISNSKVYILDTNNSLIPVGVTGEICLGGDGLARGYLNSPQLTEEKFISNPFIKGDIIYKTGDLGRWLPDGTVEFIGRKDDQVKIRGYRIEVGEIAYQLLTKEDVKESIVLAKETNSGSKELVAYLVSEEVLDISSLREYLSKRLPIYMIPAHFIQLEKLPLTTNGKVAKKLLPSPDEVEFLSGVEYVPPSNEREKELIKIWKDVLNNENIGMNDDFFELGGHSLKATRLINEYHKSFGIKLGLKDLYNSSTVHSHTILLETSNENDGYKEIRIAETLKSYPLSDAQKRLWILSQFSEGSSAYNISFQTELQGDYNVESLEKALNDAIDRHEILRTIFQEDESGEIRQWILTKETLDFKIKYMDVRSREDKQQSVDNYILEESYRPYDLEKGPLLRASLIRMADESFIFHFNMHHIISDGWSMNVLANDVLKYYEANENGVEVDLAKLRIQYKDYALWQIDQTNNEKFKNDKNYWLEILSGQLPILDLPGQNPRPKSKKYLGYKLATYISSESTTQLKDFCNENSGSLFMGVLTVWNILFHKYTQGQGFIIGTPVAGRDHLDLKNQIGCYINTLVVRNQIDPNESFIDTFKRVKKLMLKNYDHQSYPFDRLINDLKLVRDPLRNPLFDVMLSFHNIIEDNKDVTIEYNEGEIIDQGEAKSKLDMIMNFMERGEHIYFNINYDSDLYEKPLIKKIMRDYKILLKQLINKPSKKIKDIDYQMESIRNSRKKNLQKLKSY
ncbi:non-ribosomal peptide synthetase [uncultured Aquimarina sp.]|uniref:non-ribosomal peptide synthetase n=1 Tax=uncultured Aquimarina sp. TaxID=575652 RepID=UPI002604AA00|nr:non-ribosomal peptide synthetase [uncultured Aquimarina sp.]